MSTVEYRPPSGDDIVQVAKSMRLADVMEVAASSGLNPLEALIESVEDSTMAFTAVIDGKPAAIFGLIHQGMSAVIWMLGTDDLTKDRRLFTAETRRIMDGWADLYGVLHNFVDDENVDAQRWLRKAGFTLGEPVTYGVAQLPFRYFYRIGNGV